MTEQVQAAALYAACVQQATELDGLIAQAQESAGSRPVLVALDGRSGVGKTTFAAQLASRFNRAAIAADDFFPGAEEQPWQSLTPAQRVDGVIDWRRLRAEALEPLLAGHTARWRTFGWERGFGLSDDELIQSPVPVIVLDGAYSTRPELGDLIDIGVLLTLEDSSRRNRLLAREGRDSMRDWHALWDDAENHYFLEVRPPQSFDIVTSMD